MDSANQRNPFVMLTLFVAIAALKHLKTFDAAVYVFYEYAKLRQAAVEIFLLPS